MITQQSEGWKVKVSRPQQEHIPPGGRKACLAHSGPAGPSASASTG